MKLFTTILIVFLSMTKISRAQNSTSGFELTCRAKAKEIAAETYRDCITENKKKHIDELRSEYQQKLKNLKDEYEQEIKKLTDKNSDVPEQTSTKKANKKTTSKLLPSKKKSSSSARIETRKLNDDVTVQVRTGTPSSENDESTMDIPEPIPVESLPDPST